VAAMNPCPCGYFGDPLGRCSCPPERVQRYLEKISGPLLDRIDLLVEVPRISHEELRGRAENVEGGMKEVESWRERIRACRELQFARLGKLNCALGVADLEQHCVLNADSEDLLR